MKKITIFLIISILILLVHSKRICVFYNENVNGLNVVVSKCVLPDGSIVDGSNVQTGGLGDGLGLIGASRAVVVGNCLFASNDRSQTVSSFFLNNSCSTPTPGFVKEVLVQEVDMRCNKFSIDDLCMAATPNGNCLIVGLGDILAPNNVYSYKIDLNTCLLTQAGEITSPNWRDTLPYRVNGLSVSPDNNYLGAAFTSGLGAQALARINSTTCAFSSDFSFLIDSATGLTTDTTFSTDSQGRNVLLSTVAQTNKQGILDANDVSSFSSSVSNPTLLSTLTNSASISQVVANNNGGRLVYIGSPTGIVSSVDIDSSGHPVNGSDKIVAQIHNGGRITDLQVSGSGELVVSQADGFTIFTIDKNTGVLSLLGDFRSGNTTYGTAAIYQFPSCCWSGSEAISFTGPSSLQIDCADPAPAPAYTVSAQGCAVVISTITQTPASCGNLPNIVYNITAATCCGYSKNFIQTITRVDNAKPIIDLIGGTTDITINCDDDTASEALSFIAISDDCSNEQSITTTSVINRLPQCNLATKQYASGQVTINVADPCGNSDSVVENVSLFDTNSPSIPAFNASVLIPACSTLEDLNRYPWDVCSLNVTDDCNNFTCQVTKDSNENICELITRTYTVTDSCGNERQYVRIFQLSQDLQSVIISPNETALGDQSFCNPDVASLNFTFFQTTGDCLNATTVRDAPIILTEKTICYSIQIVCAHITTKCNSLCNCIPVRINSLPVQGYILPAANYIQLPGEVGHTFYVQNFTVPILSAPCGGPFDPNKFLAAGGNISVLSLNISEPTLSSGQNPNKLYDRRINVEYLFDDGCDYPIIPAFASFIVVQGSLSFVNNITIPSFFNFQTYLYTQLNITYIPPPNYSGIASGVFQAQTGYFTAW